MTVPIPDSAHSSATKKASPSGVQEALVAPSDISRVPHSHSTSRKTLTKLWLGLAHPNTISSPHIHWCNNLYLVLSFPQCSWPNDTLGYPIFQTDARLSPPLELLHLWSTHLIGPDALLLITIIKIIQNNLNPGSGWMGIPATKHMPTYTLFQSTPPSLNHQIIYQIMPLFHSKNYLDFMRYFNTFLQ